MYDPGMLDLIFIEIIYRKNTNLKILNWKKIGKEKFIAEFDSQDWNENFKL